MSSHYGHSANANSKGGLKYFGDAVLESVALVLAQYLSMFYVKG
jgi:hypothetical protein